MIHSSRDAQAVISKDRISEDLTRVIFQVCELSSLPDKPYIPKEQE
jgi:hypothetical protein